MRTSEFWSGSGTMSPLIEDNLEAIGRLCRLYGVRKLELFSSILRRDFDPEHSDVDLGVEFVPARCGQRRQFPRSQGGPRAAIGAPRRPG